MKQRRRPPFFFCISDTSNSLLDRGKNFKIYRVENFRANVLKTAGTQKGNDLLLTKSQENGWTPTSFWRGHAPKNILNLNKSGFVSEWGHCVCEPQNIVIRSLATIVSRTLQPQDGRIQYPVDRNLGIVLISHVEFLLILGQSVDN